MDVYRRLINRDLPWIERSCTSKVPLVTRGEARSTARDGRRSGGSLRPYHCRFCDRWHLGHPRRRHPRPSEAGLRTAPPPRRNGGDEASSWLGRDWWTDRHRRHLRPTRSERPWREAWAA